ncbi:PQ-loop-domain-containing protein [Obba rivulosa]|uniref:PQ-loop-domain-containing protein n=1 Tax=Obba rivulosa TaxID=1052685 RepID=A0A8E2J7A2_9APHY|nr:PQ-loop-domain-containing protein [Obba rivulosa]
MPANSAAENVLGTIGTICWTVQLIPQIWKSWRDKSTEGLSHWLLLMWGVSGAFLGVYAIVQDLNIPLIIQPQLFGVLSFVSWGQCQYYGEKRSRTTAIIMAVTATAVTAGFEVGMVFAVRPSFNKGNHGPVEAFGIISAVIISLALLPQYYEIYKHREVVGISLLFMTVDCLGGVFNDLSLAFKASFDITAGVTYSLVVFLDGTILLLAAILNPVARRRRKRAAVEITTADGSVPEPLPTMSGICTRSVSAGQNTPLDNVMSIEIDDNRV